MSYEPSPYWVHLNGESNKLIEEYGYGNFKRSVGMIYNDFYYDCSRGTYCEGYDEKIREIWDKLYEVYPKEFLDNAVEPMEGNPRGIIYRGRLVTIDLALSMVESALIAEKVNLSEIKTIHEIGAGYGRLAYILAQIIRCESYKIFDLEPSIDISRRYLRSVLPKVNFEFHSPDELRGKCDILVAVNCLHEMTKEQIERYFEYADKKASYFYYNCWEDSTVEKNGIRLKREDYPVRDSWNPLYLDKHRARINYFEALYKI